MSFNKHFGKRTKKGDGGAMLDRFMKFVNDTGGCWIWTGFTNEHGYGKFSVRNKPRRAHRVSYELHVGPIPPGLDLDHLCRVRNCVNPAHLEPVTRAENLRRAPTACISGGMALASKRKAETHCKRGHEYTPENTYLFRTWRRCRKCAAEDSLAAYYKRKGQSK